MISSGANRWACTICTYSNKEDFLCCEVCCSQRDVDRIISGTNHDDVKPSIDIKESKINNVDNNNDNDNDNGEVIKKHCSSNNHDDVKPSIKESSTNNDDNNENDNDNGEVIKKRKITNSINTMFTSPMRHEKMLKNGSSLIVISNVLDQQQLNNFKKFYDECVIIDESKGDGCYVNATNQGVLGYWKPTVDSCHTELKPFDTRGKPWLLNNYNTMISGGDTYKFIRSQKPTGFFTIGEMMNHPVYSRPAGVGGACTSSQQMSIELLDILATIKKVSNCYFNGILVNVYPNGNVNINAHSDYEGRKSSIATLSFGAEREFVIREKSKNSNFKHTIHTQNNQMIIMNGSRFQETYTHEITRDPNFNKERVSLTFRNHVR